LTPGDVPFLSSHAADCRPASKNSDLEFLDMNCLRYLQLITHAAASAQRAPMQN